MNNIKLKISSFYFKEMHAPSWFSVFFNPFFFARRGLFQSIKEIGKEITGKTLDVGCGSKPYVSLYSSTEYIGLEYDTPENRATKNADFFYDGNKFPFDDNDFDSVVLNQVFEHVFNPDDFLEEVNRVLKSSGMICMTIPFVWDEHEQPYDFARYSSFGIKSLLEKHGFHVQKQMKSVNDIRVIFQLSSLFIFKKLVTRSSIINHLMILLLISPLNIIGTLINFILPMNQDLYLDNIILAKKI